MSLYNAVSKLCENRELDVDDIKMLNNLWKAYK